MVLYYQSLVIINIGLWRSSNATIFHYMIFFRKITLAVITTDCIGKVFKYRRAVKPMVADRIFLKE